MVWNLGSLYTKCDPHALPPTCKCSRCTAIPCILPTLYNCELSHWKQTESGMVIWYKIQSAHARSPSSFRSCQNHERVFADLSSVQNQERKSQAANQRSCRWCHVHCAGTTITVQWLPFVFNLQNLQMSGEPWTSDSDSHSWLLFALEYVGARFAKALS